jgi:2-phospho-L-lactate guanylyltransferase
VDPVSIIVPVKRFRHAKSRLVDQPHRAEFAMALAQDTVAAALAAESVLVVVVTDEPQARQRLAEMGATVVPDLPDAGLNPALAHGAAQVGSGGWVGALSSDLPALRPVELAEALHRAQEAGARGYVPDRSGRGTTLLLSPPGVDLAPDFGVGSAHRHAQSGAIAVGADLPSLRTDVDTWADMKIAAELGLGPHTRDVLNRWRQRG